MKNEDVAYALVFTLGSAAPKGFEETLCVIHLPVHGERAKRLWAIVEAPVPDESFDAMIQAIEQFMETEVLWVELTADSESRADQHTIGFHSSASLAEGVAALTEGGFTVIDLRVPANRVRPRSVRLPPTEASDIATTLVAVERHLRLASPTLAFDCIRQGASTFGWHAESAAKLTLERLVGGSWSSDRDALVERARNWPRGLVDLLLVTVGYAARAAARTEPKAYLAKAEERLRALVEALPGDRDPGVHELLAVALEASRRGRGRGKNPAPAAPSPRMSLPTLAFLRGHRKELTDGLPEAFASIGKYFDLRDASTDAHTKSARAVAAELEGVVHSSDTDCDYYPCVLSGADPDSDAFFAALGLTRDARISVGGYDNPKLEVVRAGTGAGERSALALLSRLGEYELGRMSEYLDESDQEAIGAAIAKLESLGPIVGVQLCADDHATKLVLTLAKSGNAYVGVAVVRIET